MKKSHSFVKRITSLFLSLVFVLTSFATVNISSLVALADESEYFLMAYFTGNEDTRQYDNNNQAIRFAVSTDGLNFKALNDNKPAIEQLGGSLNVRDPYLFKGADDYYYIIGTDLDCITMGWWGNQPQMVIWRSLDLVNWTDETYINTAQICGLNNNQVYRTWAPEVFYDEISGKYMVYFAFAADGYSSTRMHYMLTDDLLDQSHYSKPAVLYDPGYDDIDSDIIKQGDTYYMFYKDETPGRSSVCLATASALTGPYTFVGQFATGSTTGAIEGCEVYTVGDNYYLVADRFGAAGRFAIYNLGSDLAAVAAASDGTNISVSDGNPITTVDGLNGFENLSVRHGSIMHINKTQYDALIAKYGISDQNDVRFVFDRAYSAENSWHYDTIKDASGYNFSLMTNTGGYSYVHSQSNCVAINGATMFIQDGDIKNMFDTGKSWTVSFNANIVSKRGAPLFALTSGAEANGVNSKDWIRFLDNGDFYINNGSEYVKRGSTDITTTTDYDFDITYNGTDITLYKDGVKQFTSNIGTLGFDKNGVTSYTAWGWTDTCGVTGVQATYTNIRFRSRALSAGDVASEYTDNLIYQYNEGTHEDINGRANVTYNNPQTTTTYNGKRGASFAVAGWVNVGAYKQDGAVLFEFGEGGTGDGKNYLTLLEDGTIKWCWSEGSTPRYVDIDSIYSFEADTWYYVQINVIPDGSQYHFQAFVNGESARDVTSGYNSMQTQAYGPINFLSNNRALRFGKGNAYWTTDSYNVIDDIRVYNRAVDAAANYEKVSVEDIAEDARTYVRANLESYDVETETNKINTGSTERKGYHYESVCTGGYSNILAQKTPSSADASNSTAGSTAFAGNSKVGDNKYNLFWPTDIALLYDGYHKTGMPVVLEINGNKEMTTLGINQDSGKSPDWKFDHYWTGPSSNPSWHDNIWREWPGSSYAYTTTFTGDYPTTENGGKSGVTDSNAHIGYNWGAEYDWSFTPTNGTRFFWNQCNYIGSGNTSTYYDYYDTMYARAWQNSERTIPNCTHYTYVVNYKPVFDILKASNPTAVPNTIGNLGLKAVYENLIKDHESDWTTDSLNQFYVAAYKVLTCNPVDYSEATYRADFQGTVKLASNEIKDAVNEFNKINLKSSASFTAFDSAVVSAQDILDNHAEDYTAASIEALQAALDDAEYYNNCDAETRANMSSDDYQTDINAKEAAITAAKNALVAKIVITYDRYSGEDVVVKFDPNTSAADVEAAAPALTAAHWGEGNTHYAYEWDKAFAAATANTTYTETQVNVPHDWTYTYFDGENGGRHTSYCHVSGFEHSAVEKCVYTSEHTAASGNTNGYTTYTCQYCSHQYVEYDTQNWTAYDTAVAAYDAKVAEEDFTAKYTEASRTAFASAASNKLEKLDTYSQTAIDNATTALENAVSNLAIQNYTITYKYWGVATKETAVLPYGASAEDVAAYAPENTATNYDETRHYTFAWETFAAVTGNKTYIELRTSTAHSYNAVHTDADGYANGFTTYSCECGRSYVEYDTQDWTAYDTAVAAYDAKAAEEGFETKYTAASREAFAAAASSKLTKSDTISQAAINTATTALTSAIGNLEEIGPENAYNLTLENDIDVNFYLDNAYYAEQNATTVEIEYITTVNDKDATRETETYNVSALEQAGNGAYSKVTMNAAPAQIAEPYVITVKSGETVVDTITTSIQEYCQKIMEAEPSDKITQADKDVAKALLNYGALADEYFGYAAVSKAVTNEDYEVAHTDDYKADVDAAYIRYVDGDTTKKRAVSKFTPGTDASGANITITSISYVALLDPEFRFYVSQENEVWAALTEVEVLEGDGLTAKMVKVDGKGNCVRVTGLKASDFGKTFKIRIGTATIEYNGYAYLYTVLRSDSEAPTALKDLAKGVYRYANACEAKFPPSSTTA